MARDLVEGDCVMLHASEIDSVALTTGPTSKLVGVIGAEYGGTASANTTDPVGLDAKPYAATWARNVRVRIQDNATVAYGADLALSSTTA